ncbi:MAG: glycosyltransferase family 4 protein [Bacteroidales bacterium]|nr:glycosyltransferase family 4 protein [Bacteroidales bacterium]
MKQSVIKIINESQLQLKIVHPGSNDDKIELLTEADIFTFTPGIPEGHPWVIVESMAAGLPIISTDQGAITESVIDKIK